MINKDSKIFHGFRNYGTQAGFLAKGLRDAGYLAFSVSGPDSSKRLIDLELVPAKTFIGKIRRRIKVFFLKIKWFFEFDVFHFYYAQSMGWQNLDLYFYRLFGKKVVMEYLGHDVDFCLGLNGLNDSGMKCDRLRILKRIKKQSKLVHKQLVCAPYYYQFVDHSIILPLAIDINEYEYHPLKIQGEYLTIMHCPTERVYKKSDIIEEAIDRLEKEGYKIKYKCIMGVTHSELKQEFLNSDIVIDQLNPWYGTVSIEAMALGRPVVSGFHRHLLFYDYEKFKDIPIINADVYNIYDVLKDILERKYDLEALSRASRNFVEEVHDLKKVTHQLIDIYDNL